MTEGEKFWFEKNEKLKANIEDMKQQIQVLRGALLLIEDGRDPYYGFGADFGSNGQRDYFKDAARQALDFNPERP